MINNCYEADHVKHIKKIMEIELCDIVETVRYNFKNNEITDRFTYCDSTKYSSDTLVNIVDQKSRSELLLLTGHIIGKQMWKTY